VILSPLNRTFLFAYSSRGTSDGATGAMSFAAFNSEFTLGFHTRLVGDGNLGGESVWNHYLFFCWFFFLDDVFVRVSIFVS